MDRHPQCKPPAPKHSKELQTAVQDDVRRQEVDSAKKRAAAQNVDYESFAALVSMAHLKPFGRRSHQQEEHIHALPACWSLDASGKLAAPDGLHASFSQLSCQESNKRMTCFTSNSGNLVTNSKGSRRFPQEVSSVATTNKGNVGGVKASCMTSDAFKREWRRTGMNFEEKLKLLLARTPGDLSKIFKTEVPPSIVVDVIEVLCWWKSAGGTHSDAFNSNPSGLKPFDVVVAFQLLSSLSACGRFSLSLTLVGLRVQSLAIQLIKDLAQSLGMHQICDKIADNPSVTCCSDQKVDPKARIPHGTTGTDDQVIHRDDLEHLARCYF